MCIHIKVLHAVVTFRSTMEALEMEKRAKALGIPGRLIPTPTTIVATCGLSWAVCAEDGDELEAKLAEHAIPYDQICWASL